MPRPMVLPAICALLAALVGIPAPASAQSAHEAARDAQVPSPAGAGLPRALLVDNESLQLGVRGLAQFYAIPFVGEHALLDDADVADPFPGMRFRRLQLGLEGRAAGSKVAFGLYLDLANAPTVVQARIAYTFAAPLTVEAGVLPVPFSKSAILSSGDLSFSERPHAVVRLIPDAQPGLALLGAVAEGKVSYRAGVFNGVAPGRLPGRGNDHPGVLGAARVALSPLGALRPGQADLDRGEWRAEVGLNGYYDQGPASANLAVGADCTLQGRGLTLLLEAVGDQRSPLGKPAVSPGLPAEVRRYGLVGQASYVLFSNVAAAVRVEQVDDNLALKDVGDFVGAAAGVHWYAHGGDLRVNLDFYERLELHGPALRNQALVLGTQGRF